MKRFIQVMRHYQEPQTIVNPASRPLQRNRSGRQRRPQTMKAPRQRADVARARRRRCGFQGSEE
jgi:hypothetical protein